MAELSLKDALLRENTVIVAPNRLSATLMNRPKKGEKPDPAPPDLEEAVRKVLGADADKMRASVVGRVYTGHLRKGDQIVIAKEAVPGKGYTLHGPIDVTKHWDKTQRMGAGDISPKTFFAEVGALAHPMFASRRAEPENGYFELRHA